MPSTTSSSVSRLLASSTVMTPSLPTFFIASAIMRPISASPFAEMVPTWAISSLDLTFLALASMLLDDRADGQVDAALQVHRIHAGGDRLGAFLDDGLGEHGGGGGAVAGEVDWSSRRPRAPSARPCSRTCPRARSPWRRSRRPW